MKVRIVVLALASVACTACVPVVQVKQTPALKEDVGAGKLPGIPFYVKVDEYVHSTVHERRWLRATLKIEKKMRDKKDDKEVTIDVGTQSVTRDLLAPGAELDALRAQLLKPDGGSFETAERLVKEFSALKSVSEKDVPSRMVANSVTRETVIDRSRVYYLNAPLPWFGTGNLTQELSADGTLTKVVSNPDTKLSEGLAGLLPLKEYLTGRFVKSASDAAKDPANADTVAKGLAQARGFRSSLRMSEADFIYALSLEIAPVGREYRVESPPSRTRPQVADPLPLEQSGLMLTVKDIGGEEDKAAPAKPAAPTIGIQGSIVLPKEMLPKATE